MPAQEPFLSMAPIEPLHSAFNAALLTIKPSSLINMHDGFIGPSCRDQCGSNAIEVGRPGGDRNCDTKHNVTNIRDTKHTILPVAEPVISNNIVPNSIPNIFWKAGLPIAETISPNVAPCYSNTGHLINNLANALQLLVVGNLLSNTLPLNDVVAPMR
ncbi:hypothetical protein EVAR_100285_1 [Eumeta japonica]|uniref:Uncharacterized protein n=1 Tax=Eumeta variegata TaxID=151549 RepID=A0A4C2A3P3_EUMVA|nr:hypothetical protein EVAR_100285_1 [Eumeta japonica]